jgi:glycosyltransferase domain-containing protein
MKVKNIFTIIIPTYNRYKFLKRSLDFYCQFKNNFNILILDSSNKSVKKNLNYFNYKKNIQYIKFNSSIFIADKIAQGSVYVKTPYSVLCADDDFVVPNAVLKCIQFLKKQKDYSSVQGLCYKHELLNKNGKFKLKFNLSNSSFESIELENPIKRLYIYSNNHYVYNSYYAVQRNKTFLKIWSESSKYAKDWAMAEFFPCAMSLLLGKMKVLPIYFNSRKSNQEVWFDEKRLVKMFSSENISTAAKGLALQLSSGNNRKKIKLFKQIIKLINNYRYHAIGKFTLNRFLLKIFYKIKKLTTKIFILKKINIFSNDNLKIENSLNYNLYLKIKDLILKNGDLSYLASKSRKDYSQMGIIKKNK